MRVMDPNPPSMFALTVGINVVDDHCGFQGLHSSKNIIMNMKSTSAYIILLHREDLESRLCVRNIERNFIDGLTSLKKIKP